MVKFSYLAVVEAKPDVYQMGEYTEYIPESELKKRIAQIKRQHRLACKIFSQIQFLPTFEIEYLT